MRRIEAALEGDGKVAKEVEPESQFGDEAPLVMSAIANQLQGVIAIGIAKGRGIEAQQKGVDLFRHSPLAGFSWPWRPAAGRLAFRLRSVRVCDRRQSDGSS